MEKMFNGKTYKRVESEHNDCLDCCFRNERIVYRDEDGLEPCSLDCFYKKWVRVKVETKE